MSTRWVTFDCFGTLVDWHAGFAAILAPLAGSRTPELIRAYHEFERALEAERPHRLYRDILVEALLRAADKTGLGISPAEARRLPDSWSTLRKFDDIEEMLAGLRAMNLRLGVLTNCDEDLFEKTHRQFRQRFDSVVTAERVLDYKPSTSHFQYFSRAAGVGPDHWVHVACSWYHDIAPARALGIRRVWLDRDRTGDDTSAATARIDSAAELAATVQNLLVIR
jgi:2-haloacid dehalogenase